MLYKLRYNENENGTVENENGTMEMRMLQYNTIQYLPKWDTAVGDYATHRGISIRKTDILVSIAAGPHIFHQVIVAYWRHMVTHIWVNTGSVVAWCRHYLNQFWLLISEVLWHRSESNSTARTQAIILHNELESYILKITVISTRGHCVITVYTENKTPFSQNSLSWNMFASMTISSCPWHVAH